MLGIKKVGTSLKVMWGTREHKQIFQGNKGTGTPPGRVSLGNMLHGHEAGISPFLSTHRAHVAGTLSKLVLTKQIEA